MTGPHNLQVEYNFSVRRPWRGICWGGNTESIPESFDDFQSGEQTHETTGTKVKVMRAIIRFFARISSFKRCWIAFVFAVTSYSSALGAENVWSVQKLNDNKPWDKFVDSPIAIRVEGRIGGFGSGQFRLLRCDAKFVVDNAKLRSVAPKSTIEVSGRFKRDGAKLEFAVDDLKVVQGYSEQYESKVLKLKRASAVEWTELGDWAARLGQFYEDAELAKKASLAYAKAIDVESESLKPTDAEGRFSLAKKVDEFKLSPRRRMEFIHEGLRIQWLALQKQDPVRPDSWEQFANDLSSHLDGTTQPLTKVARDLKEAYDQDPVSVYRKATDEVRMQLHRLFFVAVTRKWIMHAAAPDGRNGDSIADRLEDRIPEETLLADQQRLLRIDYRVANATTATRGEIENLAVLLRERGKNDLARQTLIQWVRSHELRLKGDGAVGLLQLSDEYLNLLNNEAVAVEYLTDAYRLDPTFEEVKKKLTALGYHWRNGRWMKGEEHNPNAAASTPESPMGIVPNMTATEVRKLLGQPGSLSRAITSRGITEVWSYGPAGGSRLVVRLEKKGLDADPKVVDAFNSK